MRKCRLLISLCASLLALVSIQLWASDPNHSDLISSKQPESPPKDAIVSYGITSFSELLCRQDLAWGSDGLATSLLDEIVDNSLSEKEVHQLLLKQKAKVLETIETLESFTKELKLLVDSGSGSKVISEEHKAKATKFGLIRKNNNVKNQELYKRLFADEAYLLSSNKRLLEYLNIGITEFLSFSKRNDERKTPKVGEQKLPLVATILGEPIYKSGQSYLYLNEGKFEGYCPKDKMILKIISRLKNTRHFSISKAECEELEKLNLEVSDIYNEVLDQFLGRTSTFDPEKGTSIDLAISTSGLKEETVNLIRKSYDDQTKYLSNFEISGDEHKSFRDKSAKEIRERITALDEGMIVLSGAVMEADQHPKGTAIMGYETVVEQGRVSIYPSIRVSSGTYEGFIDVGSVPTRLSSQPIFTVDINNAPADTIRSIKNYGVNSGRSFEGAEESDWVIQTKGKVFSEDVREILSNVFGCQ